MHHEIKDDIIEIKKSVANIDRTLAVNTESLKQHMERTKLNEERISKIEAWALGLVTTMVVATLSYLVFKR